MRFQDEQIGIRIEKTDKAWLKKEAKKRKISMANLIRYWIDLARVQSSKKWKQRQNRY